MKRADKQLLNQANPERKEKLLQFASAVALSIDTGAISRGIAELMSATTNAKVPKRTPSGETVNRSHGAYDIVEDVPDMTARNNGLKLALQWLELAAAYEIGKPVERQEVVHVNMTPPEERAREVTERLVQSPAAMESIARLLLPALMQSESGRELVLEAVEAA